MEPCVICCSPVNVTTTVSSKRKHEDDQVFKWFLTNLQFPAGQSLFGSGSMLLKVGWGWDNQGGVSEPLPFCKVCRAPLAEWIRGSLRLEWNKEISEEIPQIRRRMEACEAEFEKSGIYQRDPRYWNVRRNVIKVNMMVGAAGEPRRPKTRKRRKPSLQDFFCDLSGGGNEVVTKVEVEVQVKEELISHTEDFISEGDLEEGDDDLGCMNMKHCLLCYKAISKEESEMAPVLTNDKVEANLNAVFVLRKMLNVPSSKLQDYLTKFGCPDKWLQYCRRCLCLVDEALRIQKDIIELENKLRGYQAKMKEEIKSTFQITKKSRISVSPNPPEVSQVTEETREYVNSSLSSLPTVNRKLELNLLEVVPPLIARDPLADSPTSSPAPGQSEDDEYSKELNSLSLDEKLSQGNYKCPSCPFLETMSLSQFYSHVIFHKKRPFKCTQCSLYWSSPTELENNPLATAFPGNPGGHLCSESTLVINTEGKFNPGEIWNCYWCVGTSFDCEFERHHHEMEYHSDGYQEDLLLNYPCLLCQSKNKKNAYRSYEEWLLHRVLEHTEVAITSCLYCEETKGIKTNKGIDILHTDEMQKHVFHHHPSFRIHGYPEACDFCGKTFNSGPGQGKDLLVDHIQNIHGLAPQCTQSCPICHYKCSEQEELRDHVASSHAVARTKKVQKKKQGVCDICGKKVWGPIYLIDHKLVQHGIEPEKEACGRNREILNCEQDGCGYRTLIGRFLKEHMMKKHGTQRSCICEQCGKGFTESSKLKVHLQIHENKGVKPYQCEICGNSFAVKNYLYIHMRLSHQNRPFASTNKGRSKKRPGKTVQRNDNLNVERSTKTS